MIKLIYGSAIAAALGGLCLLLSKRPDDALRMAGMVLTFPSIPLLAYLLVQKKRIWISGLEQRGSAVPAYIALAVSVLFALAIAGKFLRGFSSSSPGSPAAAAAVTHPGR
jgi:hypothetical protein